MSNKKNLPDIEQRLKWELYGRMIACGVIAAVMVIAMAVKNKKERSITVPEKIEQVKNIKNNVIDSVNHRVR